MKGAQLNKVIDGCGMESLNALVGMGAATEISRAMRRLLLKNPV